MKTDWLSQCSDELFSHCIWSLGNLGGGMTFYNWRKRKTAEISKSAQMRQPWIYLICTVLFKFTEVKKKKLKWVWYIFDLAVKHFLIKNVNIWEIFGIYTHL